MPHIVNAIGAKTTFFEKNPAKVARRERPRVRRAEDMANDDYNQLEANITPRKLAAEQQKASDLSTFLCAILDLARLQHKHYQNSPQTLHLRLEALRKLIATSYNSDSLANSVREPTLKEFDKKTAQISTANSLCDLALIFNYAITPLSATALLLSSIGVALQFHTAALVIPGFIVGCALSCLLVVGVTYLNQRLGQKSSNLKNEIDYRKKVSGAFSTLTISRKPSCLFPPTPNQCPTGYKDAKAPPAMQATLV